MEKEKNETSRKKQCVCYDPLVYNCLNCPELDKCRHALEYHQQIPHYLTDGHLMQLKPTALKVFLYLNRLANFNPADKNYGKCTVTYATIQNKTGIKSDIRRYIVELKDCGLIDYDDIAYTQRDDKYHTGHEYTMIHLIKKRELRPDDQTDKSKTPSPTSKPFNLREDECPEITAKIKQLWEEKGLKPATLKYDEDNFRKASVDFMRFIKTNQRKLNFVVMGELIERPVTLVKYLLKALFADVDDISIITTGYICSIKMFDYRLPKYLCDMGLADSSLME